MGIWHSGSVVTGLETKWACSIYMVLNIATALSTRNIHFVQTFLSAEETTCHRERWMRPLGSPTIKVKKEKSHLCGGLSSCNPHEGFRDGKTDEIITWSVSLKGHSALAMSDSGGSARGWHWGGTCLHSVRHMWPGYLESEAEVTPWGPLRAAKSGLGCCTLFLSDSQTKVW